MTKEETGSFADLEQEKRSDVPVDDTPLKGRLLGGAKVVVALAFLIGAFVGLFALSAWQDTDRTTLAVRIDNDSGGTVRNVRLSVFGREIATIAEFPDDAAEFRSVRIVGQGELAVTFEREGQLAGPTAVDVTSSPDRRLIVVNVTIAAGGETLIRVEPVVPERTIRAAENL